MNLKKALVIASSLVLMALAAVPVNAATKEVAIKNASFSNAVTVKVGESKKLTVSTTPTNATNKTYITWTLSKSGIATKKANGTGTLKSKNSSVTITGKKAGTVNLVATIKCYNNKNKVVKTIKKTCKVTVVKNIPLKSIKLNKTATTLNVGKAESLKVTFNPTNTNASKKVTWKSSNTAVATVSGGKITAKKAGTATITATCGSKKATCKVTVKAVVTKVTLSKTKAEIEEGDTLVLSAKISPTDAVDAKNATWTTSNKNVATVSSTGKVTAVHEGTATITAKVGTKSASCVITVDAEEEIDTTMAGTFVDTTECYTKLNSIRTSAKVATLKKDDKLEKFAKIRAQELTKRFDHYRPNNAYGPSIIPGNLFKGENIARGQRTCAAVMTAWNASADHRANMIDGDYTKVGIAGFQFEGRMYWVQLFSS